jgi:hypothetical protein
MKELTTQDKEKFKDLVYNFYCDLLKLYEKNRLVIRFFDYIVSDDVGCSYQQKPKALNSYFYNQYKGEVESLTSFIALLQFCEDNLAVIDVFSLKHNLYDIGQDLFNKYNLESNLPSNYKLNFNPVSSEKLIFNSLENLEVLGLSTQDWKNKKIYYCLEMFDVYEDIVILFKGEEIFIKRLSNEEKTELLSADFMRTVSMRDSLFFGSAIVSPRELENNELENILALLRIYQEGDFRCCYVAKIVDGIVEKKCWYMMGTTDLHEQSYKECKEVMTRSLYEVNLLENVEINKFFSENLEKIDDYPFAVSCLNSLYFLDEQFKIPQAFYILESFFPNIKSELSFRLVLYITKLLKENHNFSQRLSVLYDLRSKIVHGNSKERDKNLKKNFDGKIEVANDFILDVVRRVWKVFLKNDKLESDQFEKKYIYNEKIN